MSGSRFSIRARTLAGVALLTIATPAWAQTVAPAPARQSVDANGVDLFRGTLNVASPKISMGSGDQGLSYYYLNAGGGWTDNVTAALDQSGNVVTVRLGAATDDFTVSGSTYVSMEGHGATLVKNGAAYTYTATDGSVVHFAAGRANSSPYYANLGRAVESVDPSGSKLVYDYGQTTRCTRWKPTGEGYVCTARSAMFRLNSITSSYGYALNFSYASDEPEEDVDSGSTNVGEWSSVTGMTLNNLKRGGPGQSLPRSFGPGTMTVNGPEGQTTYRTDGTRVHGITRPGSSTENVTVSYANARVASVATVAGTWSYGAPQDSGGTRTVTVTDPSSAVTSYTFNIASARMTGIIDALGRTTSWQYDGVGRVTLATAPEGNAVAYVYDARGNVTTTTVRAKPGSGQADIVTTAGFDASCANVRTCNSPNWARDAKGAQTDYAYDPTHGGVTSVTAPADANAVRSQVRTSYTGFTDQFGGALYRETSTVACRTASACAGTADEAVTTIGYGTLADTNLLPVTVTRRAGDDSLSARAGVGYDTIGNVVSATDALGAVTRFRYDAARRRVLAVSSDPDGGGPRRSAAVRTSWNGDDTVARVEAGSAAEDGSGFAAAQQVDNLYDTAGRPLRETLSSGGTAYAVMQYGYDSAARRTCTVVRMDPAQWSGQGDACLPQASGPNGPDRVTLAQYDALGRISDVTRAHGTGAAATEHRAYSVNGQSGSVTDANGNVTGYGYDGFDRLATTTYPGGSYESLGYDANGNVVNRRLRDGQTLAYGYDALNRRTFDDNPNTNVAEMDVSYAYDVMGNLTLASDQNGWLKAYEYDALGRVTRERSNVADNFYRYDAAGHRTRHTWSDGFFVTYGYDAAGSLTTIRENGGLALATFGYDDMGRRTSLARGDGTVTGYVHDAAGRLAQFTHYRSAAGQVEQRYTFGYNPAGQIDGRVMSNDAYAWTGAVSVERNYGVNALNQYTSAGATTFGYDGRGNLTNSGSATFGYNTRNQMFQAPGVQLIYRGPSGELGQVIDARGTATNFDWASGQLGTEMSGNAIVRRYVYGPGADEALVWYEGAGTTDRRYLHADERGSIVSVTNDAGNTIAVNTYDEYGIPGAGNIGRFQYTGQIWLPQVGLYDYKARMYSPTLGRFLQTDPIGYDDGMHWYDYVGGDPVNRRDPTGRLQSTGGSSGSCVVDNVFYDYCGTVYGPSGGGGGGGGFFFPPAWLTPPPPREVNPGNGSGPSVEEAPQKEEGSEIVVNGRRLPHSRIADPRWPAAMQPNGCSGVPQLFPQSCNVHDVCYVTVGVARSLCDRQFYFNMMVERPNLRGYALDYYIGVINLGGRFYQDGQRLGREYQRSVGR